MGLDNTDCIWSRLQTIIRVRVGILLEDSGHLITRSKRVKIKGIIS